MDYERIMIIGNTALNALVKKDKDSGKRYADFTVVVRNRSGGTTDYPVRCFSKLAQTEEIKAIGMETRVFVEGEPDITTRTGDDGIKRVTFRVIANTYRIFNSGRRPEDSNPASKQVGKLEMTDEDLPF